MILPERQDLHKLTFGSFKPIFHPMKIEHAVGRSLTVKVSGSEDKIFLLVGEELKVNLDQDPHGAGRITRSGGEAFSCRVYEGEIEPPGFPTLWNTGIRWVNYFLPSFLRLKPIRRVIYQAISGPEGNTRYVGPEVRAKKFPITEGNPMGTDYRAYAAALDPMRRDSWQRSDS